MNEEVFPRKQKQNSSSGYAEPIEEVDLHEFNDQPNDELGVDKPGPPNSAYRGA